MANSRSDLSIPSWTALPRPLLMMAAIILFGLASLYCVMWMYDVRFTQVELGFNKLHTEIYDPETHSIPVGDVEPGSPAEHAGLRAGDAVVGVNGRSLTTAVPYNEAWAHGHPGDAVILTVIRPGKPGPIELRGVFRKRGSALLSEGVARSSAEQITNSFPVLFLLVGFAVLFLRLDDNNAWLLALTFSAFATAPGIATTFLSPGHHNFAYAYRTFFFGLLPSFFYIFFARFPVRSPLERRIPWLKWVALAAGLATVFPGWHTGVPRFPQIVSTVLGDSVTSYLQMIVRYTFFVLGIVSLAQNSFTSSTPCEARRKSKIILWGTIVGVMPAVLLRLTQDLWGYSASYWVNTIAAIILILYPLSFAYAVVKHRVMEIPVLLRRSARFVLVQRGYFIVLFCGGCLAIFLFARFFAGYFVRNSQLGMTLSAAFGIALVWVSRPFVRRGTDQIDRAFFRSSYDARIILQDLAQKTLSVTHRTELATLLSRHIEQALHPKSLACYLESADGTLVAQDGAAPHQPSALQPLPRPHFPFRSGARFVLREAAAIPATHPLLVELARGGKAWDVPPAVLAEAGGSDALAPECLVPVLGRTSGLIGLLVLGPRLSEEPYSSEDKGLLESVAGQASIAIENMRLAEQMADRLEADRRASHEMQIARDVQARLFPQSLPRVANLEYAGSCLQARQVGGDYYDALDLGSPQRMDRGASRELPAAAWHLAFVLADISGKGIAGALLMANLQANLRSRYALALDDLPRLLRSVNQLFYENTPDDRYATLFFAVYDDHSRELEYVNCGHNPPLLFRADGSIERLEATSTVIGLFPKWECTTRRITLATGDLLVIYTDGVTEATDASSTEFGEKRLIETVCRNRHLPATELITAIQQAVQQFSVGEQSDDLTLLIARSL